MSSVCSRWKPLNIILFLKVTIFLSYFVIFCCCSDLKSSNLVVDSRWVVKVTDFGMSRVVSPENSDQVPIGEETDNDGTKPDQLDNLMMVRNIVLFFLWSQHKHSIMIVSMQFTHNIFCYR